jgi:hypothetical protein
MGLGSEIRDPISGIRKKLIPDPGSRGQKGTGSQIRIRNPALHVTAHLGECAEVRDEKADLPEGLGQLDPGAAIRHCYRVINIITQKQQSKQRFYQCEKTKLENIDVSDTREKICTVHNVNNSTV